MLKGKTLAELAIEIERQAQTKKDFVAADTHIALADDAEQLQIGTVGSFAMGDVAHDQLRNFTQIPAVYYDRLRHQAPALAAANVNHWLRASEARHLVRTVDGRARAMLSDRYRPLDYADLLEAILPAALEAQLTILSCEVTDRRLYVQAVSPRLEGEVKVGDAVQMGVVVSNSEVGCGAVRVERLIYRLFCKNGMVRGNAVRQAHVGKRVGNGGTADDFGAEYFSDSTRRLDDAAFFAKTRDVMKGVLTQEHFERELEALRSAAQRFIPLGADLPAVVERVADRLGFAQRERGSLLTHLAAGGDLSAWGLANAVTRLAHDAESYDRSVELERAGSAIVELPRSEWRELVEVSAAA